MTGGNRRVPSVVPFIVMRSATARLTAIGIVTACAYSQLSCGSSSVTDPDAGGGNPPPATGRTPLTELAQQAYLGFPGALYPGGNVPPVRHDSVGRAERARIRPLDAAGNPAANGRYVLLSIGMSNTTQEFCGTSPPAACNSWTFAGQAAADPAVNRTALVIANGAAGGQSAAFWDAPSDANYDRVRGQVLAPLGVGERQVQAAWVKVANPGPSVSLPAGSADAYTLVRQMGDIVRAMRQRYPNLRQVFFSSRISAEFANTNLNPEPYAYESGFSVKWVIEAQIQQAVSNVGDPRAGDLRYDATPWLAWGPYIWGGQSATSAGAITWTRQDLAADGTHPSQSGQQKVGTALLAFFKGSPYTACWFLAGQACQGGD